MDQFDPLVAITSGQPICRTTPLISAETWITFALPMANLLFAFARPLAGHDEAACLPGRND